MFSKKKHISYMLSFVLVFTAAVLFSSKSASASYKVNRLSVSGGDRYSTAIRISQEGWGGTSENVVLATGVNYPDALSAGPLAKKLDAPILLVGPLGIDGKLSQELARLNPKNIFIVGGNRAISREVELELDEGFENVVRIKGSDRYDTALETAKYMAEKFSISNEVVIATGADFPDALSVAPVAAVKGMPIILSKAASLPEGLSEFISENGIDKAYLVGGPKVLKEDLLESLPEGSERISGKNRYETNAKILSQFKDDIDYKKVYVATGVKFPDALAGSAIAAKTSSPLMLTGTAPDNVIKDIMEIKYSLIEQINVLGGEKVVLSSALEQLIPEFNTIGNSGGNTGGINMGIAAEQGDWIYYNDGAENAALYKIRKDGTGRTLLSENDAAFINVVGEWVYYFNVAEDQEDGGIYKVRTDGTEETKISGDAAWGMNVVGDWIYYTEILEGGIIYRVKTDGSDKTRLSDRLASEFYVSEGWVYFIGHGLADEEYQGQLYKVRTDGTDESKVFDDIVMYVNVVDGWIYYQNLNQDIDEVGRIYKVKTDGTGKTKVNDDLSMFINVADDGWIYYANYGDMGFGAPEDMSSGKLYRIKTDGKGRVELSSHSPAVINVVGDWVYYGSIEDEKFYRVKVNGTSREAVK